MRPPGAWVLRKHKGERREEAIIMELVARYARKT